MTCFSVGREEPLVNECAEVKMSICIQISSVGEQFLFRARGLRFDSF